MSDTNFEYESKTSAPSAGLGLAGGRRALDERTVEFFRDAAAMKKLEHDARRLATPAA